jgi:hypothetical protein
MKHPGDPESTQALRTAEDAPRASIARSGDHPEGAGSRAGIFPNYVDCRVRLQGAVEQLTWRALLWLLLSAAVTASAAEYEVDGEIVQTIFWHDGNVQLVKRSAFTVFVKGPSWLIHTTDEDLNGEPLVRETACANGAEIYEVEGHLTQDNAIANPRAPLDWNVASIVSNNVPVGQTDDYFVCHLWLMFASGCYFEHPATNWLTPVFDSNASVAVDPTLKREAKWELISGPGSLPLSVVYLEGARLTNATYAATGVTNAGEIPMASGFVFEERVGYGFGPGTILSGDSVPTYRIRKHAVATVTAVRPMCSRRELLPTAKGMTMVSDQRLAHATTPIECTTYIVRNGVRWVSVAEAKRLSLLSRRGRQKHSLVVVWAMALIAAAPMLFLIRRGAK